MANDKCNTYKHVLIKKTLRGCRHAVRKQSAAGVNGKKGGRIPEQRYIRLG